MNSKTKDLYQPETRNENAARSVLILTADKTEDLEFFYPYYRFIEAGYRVDVATPAGGEFKGKQGLGLKETKKTADVGLDDYAMLYIPGGKAPAELKGNVDALNIVRDFVNHRKPIAAICHGPQILAAANVIDHRRIAAWPEIKDEITVAGAMYVDEEVVLDGQFITARWPGDLPAHMKQTLKELERVSRAGEDKQRYAAA